MANKRKVLFLGLSVLSFAPLLLSVSCSDISYQIIIPKILDADQNRIKTDISADIDAWTKKYNNVDAWIKTDTNTTGYITGGNVSNISSITHNINSESILEIKMQVDPKKDFRFIRNQIEHIILIDLNISPK